MMPLAPLACWPQEVAPSLEDAIRLMDKGGLLHAQQILSQLDPQKSAVAQALGVLAYRQREYPGPELLPAGANADSGGARPKVADAGALAAVARTLNYPAEYSAKSASTAFSIFRAAW